jgi:hypothetical protein
MISCCSHRKPLQLTLNVSFIARFAVLTTVFMNMQISRYITPCRLVNMCQHLPKNLFELPNPEDGDTTVLQNIGNYFAIQHGLISQRLWYSNHYKFM